MCVASCIIVFVPYNMHLVCAFICILYALYICRPGTSFQPSGPTVALSSSELLSSFSSSLSSYSSLLKSSPSLSKSDQFSSTSLASIIYLLCITCSGTRLPCNLQPQKCRANDLGYFPVMSSLVAQRHCRNSVHDGKYQNSACHSVCDSRPHGEVIIVTASVTAIRAQR